MLLSVLSPDSLLLEIFYQYLQNNTLKYSLLWTLLKKQFAEKQDIESIKQFILHVLDFWKQIPWQNFLELFWIKLHKKHRLRATDRHFHPFFLKNLGVRHGQMTPKLPQWGIDLPHKIPGWNFVSKQIYISIF